MLGHADRLADLFLNLCSKQTCLLRSRELLFLKDDHSHRENNSSLLQ
uniref:Uncharacterized protein n=1 Tax=Arundo donax TaxID=35708 RepID=A0A0A9GTA3_ARUDO